MLPMLNCVVKTLRDQANMRLFQGIIAQGRHGPVIILGYPIQIGVVTVRESLELLLGGIEMHHTRLQSTKTHVISIRPLVNTTEMETMTFTWLVAPSGVILKLGVEIPRWVSLGGAIRLKLISPTMIVGISNIKTEVATERVRYNDVLQTRVV
jgi:hypothetical protein